MGRTARAVALAVLASLGLGTAHANATTSCHIVTDPAGDASLRDVGGIGAPNDDPLDVLSADIASGPRDLTVVVRVAHLGSALDAGPRLNQWITYFVFRGHAFAATAARAVDGDEFYLAGEFPEKSTAPGFTATVPVKGSFVESADEVRITVPRDLVGRTKRGDKISKITVDTVTGVGSLATEATGAYAGTTVDRTIQPGATTTIGAASCVRST